MNDSQPPKLGVAQRRARRLVISDPEILGGAPVFRGTRVPVHLIAELVAQGDKSAELMGSYPRLTAEMIRLAPIMPPPILCESRSESCRGAISRRFAAAAGSITDSSGFNFTT